MQFAKYQKGSIDTGLSDDFMAENLKQPNANKVHALTEAMQVALTVSDDPCQYYYCQKALWLICHRTIPTRSKKRFRAARMRLQMLSDR